jgi:hypothetical protein
LRHPAVVVVDVAVGAVARGQRVVDAGDPVDQIIAPGDGCAVGQRHPRGPVQNVVAVGGHRGAGAVLERRDPVAGVVRPVDRHAARIRHARAVASQIVAVGGLRAEDLTSRTAESREQSRF